MATPRKHARYDQTLIGERIRKKRKELGYSAASLGAKVGINPDAMLKKEKGVAPFTFDELTRICDLIEAPTLFPVLDWDVAWMVERLLPPSVRALPET